MHLDTSKLRRLRERRGWLRTDLAINSGVSRPYVAQIEDGVRCPSPRVVARLAAALGVAPDELLAAEAGVTP